MGLCFPPFILCTRSLAPFPLDYGNVVMAIGHALRALGRNDFQGTEIQIKAAYPNALINNLEPDNLVNARQTRKERKGKWQIFWGEKLR